MFIFDKASVLLDVSQVLYCTVDEVRTHQTLRSEDIAITIVVIFIKLLLHCNILKAP